MRNVCYMKPTFVSVCKPSKKNTTRLYFEDVATFFKELKRERKYKKKHNKRR